MLTSITYRVVKDSDDKAKICNAILRALPNWFGNKEAIVDYAAQVRNLPLCAAFDGGNAVGFAALKRQTEFAQELCVMGVLPDFHRRGIGRELVKWCADTARNEGARLLTVKTLADTDPHEGYAATRRFYVAQGFFSVELFPLLWDEDNPCLLMAQIL